MTVLRGDARRLPLPDGCVDLIVTSPPYYGLRSYTDGCPSCSVTAQAKLPGYMPRICPACGTPDQKLQCRKCGTTTVRTAKASAVERSDCPACGGTGQLHYAGQIGSEATPAEYVAALVACTREWVRVLKPSGSLFVNLGDKYATSPAGNGQPSGKHTGNAGAVAQMASSPRRDFSAPHKSLLGLPWRYALACMDQLGLILRAEIVWAKPNGLPESVTDRVRRAHEQVFHFTRQPRYYSAVDEIREDYDPATAKRYAAGYNPRKLDGQRPGIGTKLGGDTYGENPLGKLPGSVWSIPSAPLVVPARLGVDHFAAFPPALVRPIVLGWSPPGVCQACGEGRRPVVDADLGRKERLTPAYTDCGINGSGRHGRGMSTLGSRGPSATITGYVCACPHPDAPTRPALVVDPFGGTGTTALVAAVHGRHGITVDASADYCRLAAWRCHDPGERARALDVPRPPVVPDDQVALFDV